ncbi:glycosyltransferase-like protein LARGE [Clonorchis sinensis]|uniref:Glycosyltransferase-like protein LARGE n=1 Tax=Clonorchis sinensis TaxID=79923 RepID=G7YE62_CLOSI|nr:glycosyltransferase-like protein LARGE [Clonorchis sinensis]
MGTITDSPQLSGPARHEETGLTLVERFVQLSDPLNWGVSPRHSQSLSYQSLTLNWYLSNPLDIIKTPTFPKIDLNPTPHTIHLVHVIKGEATLARSITLLKSVLYYRGSLRSKRPECHLRRIPSPHLCAKQRAIEQIAIHLHLVVEQRLLSAAYSYVSQWRVARLNWTLYELDPYLPRVNWIPNKHGSGVAALSKMLIPDMLPTNVTKAIVLDTDILFNADILELWKLFDDFDQSQKNGVNSGVVLMHLSRMREAKWSELFDWAVRKVLILYGTLWLGEQSASEIILFSFSIRLVAGSNAEHTQLDSVSQFDV